MISVQLRGEQLLLQGLKVLSYFRSDCLRDDRGIGDSVVSIYHTLQIRPQDLSC